MNPLATAVRWLRVAAERLQHHVSPHEDADLGGQIHSVIADLQRNTQPVEARIVKDWPRDPLAWDNEVPIPGQSHASLQWKGTNACLDVHCQCGKHGHIDDWFCYFYKCLACGRTYAIGETVRMYECSPEIAADKYTRAKIDPRLEEAPALTQGTTEPEAPLDPRRGPGSSSGSDSRAKRRKP